MRRLCRDRQRNDYAVRRSAHRCLKICECRASAMRVGCVAGPRPWSARTCQPRLPTLITAAVLGWLWGCDLWFWAAGCAQIGGFRLSQRRMCGRSRLPRAPRPYRSCTPPTAGRGISSTSVAHDDAELELLKAAARRRLLAAGQGELDLGLDDNPEAGGPLEITCSRMGHLWDALSLAGRAGPRPSIPPRCLPAPGAVNERPGAGRFGSLRPAVGRPGPDQGRRALPCLCEQFRQAGQFSTL
jgi:hypothetical protein